MSPETEGQNDTGLQSRDNSEPKKATRTFTEELRQQKVLIKHPMDELQDSLGHAAQFLSNIFMWPGQFCNQLTRDNFKENKIDELEERVQTLQDEVESLRAQVIASKKHNSNGKQPASAANGSPSTVMCSGGVGNGVVYAAVGHHVALTQEAPPAE